MAEVAVDPILRLRAVPWEALRGLADPAVETLREVLDGVPAERALDGLLRARRHLGAEQRTALAESIFGVALWRRRLSRELGLSRWEEADPRQLLCALLCALGAIPEARARALASVPAEARLRWTPGAATSLADRWSLPDWLAATLEREEGSEAATLAAALCAPGPISLRANRLRAAPAELAASLSLDGIATEPGRLAPHALRVLSARPNLLAARAHRAGLFEAQDEGSQLLGALVGARPGEAVLDACAGAGGKTLLLAADMGDRGRLLAADVDAEKLGRLRVRARRAGATCIEVRAPGAPPEARRFDRALVDAPCSELGALRRGPDARWRLRPEGFAPLPRLQLSLLSSAAEEVRPGGRLVYATCTLRREENEEVAEAFAEDHPDFERVAPGDGRLDPSLVRGGFFRSLPHVHGCDGFFAAVYLRREDRR